MSLLIGPASGALIAGGVYYGFSNLIHTRTEQHRKDLHALSIRLIETPSLVQAPPSAATRIIHHPFSSQVRAKWNEEVESIFIGFREWDRRALDWGRKLLYGTESSSTLPSKSQD